MDCSKEKEAATERNNIANILKETMQIGGAKEGGGRWCLVNH